MQIKHLIKRAGLLGWFALLVSLTFNAYAQPFSSGWLSDPKHPPIETRFVLTGLVDQEQRRAEGFLEVRLSDDWKTYWRSPGEGGIAPSMSWEGSNNIEAVNWYWPYPERYSILGIETLGYQDSVVFPISVVVEDFNQPTKLNAKLTLSSCTTICVLTDYFFELDFAPAKLKVNADAAHAYYQAMSRVPQPSPLIEKVEAGWDDQTSLLQVTLEHDLGWKKPEILIDGSSSDLQETTFTPLEYQVDGTSLVARFEASSWMGTPELAGQNITVTVHDDQLLSEYTVVANPQAIVQSTSQSSLLQMILFAFLGGLVLNIMPCVLPVLGMKLSSVISSQGLEKRQIRLQFFASAMGVLASFWLIAGALAVLKVSGSAIGWGVQFQSGWFIGLMVLVTAIFGANMLGLFEIRLPSQASTWVASKGDNSYRGNFIQGMFATLLATPCSAPFLGTAVAFALATSISTMFVIFTFLALGMAFPWLLVAAFPNIARLMPKPGPWMNYVKVLFGSMMLITSVWLLTLLSSHLPVFWVVVIGIAGFVFVFYRVMKIYGERAAAWLGGISVVFAGLGFMIGGMTADHWSTPLPQDPNWQPLSVQTIQQQVDAGKTVFVNVTADWCITCKANEIGVILQQPVYGKLTSANVVAMEGDWTVPSEKVTDYLQANGRYGVPFNMVYGPNAPQGIPLPVILTQEAVMDALNKASG
ncbi:protein-disulfide reductase DsbD domain-containing protein [Vibrio sp. SCSIO 43136]|uniref:protein-disulfide reductase DsbD family protein n=1 Tax=Vibrio sp. SCSIO 43136 TaxID=2819101 RepID=UPI0020761F94|nr:protein-disulfide reductase DsbD domain-containing protein [Vibrio sp. SCSIO 43136]USD66081.1 thioredoxin family protein [Vibrio sp. SCSIO 43136]